MTLKEIKAQFIHGDRWTCRREERRPNMGTNLIQTSLRTVQHAGPTYLTWRMDTGQPLETKWPRASEIIEASPGFLQFHYFDGGVVLTFTKEPRP